MARTSLEAMRRAVDLLSDPDRPLQHIIRGRDHPSTGGHNYDSEAVLEVSRKIAGKRVGRYIKVMREMSK